MCLLLKSNVVVLDDAPTVCATTRQRGAYRRRGRDLSRKHTQTGRVRRQDAIKASMEIARDGRCRLFAVVLIGE
jgi:hypothetical protein